MSGAANGSDSNILDAGLGDWVEHKANTNVFGIVIGFEGSLIVVRLSASLVTAKFHEFELEAMEDGDEMEPAADEQVDYTNVVDLATARTKGVA